MRLTRMFAITGVVSVVMTAIGLALAEAEAAPLTELVCPVGVACPR
ncbi:hypothetical protein ACFVMC_13185 [Nocardia sp. NPDC127579]